MNIRYIFECKQYFVKESETEYNWRNSFVLFVHGIN